MATATNVQIRDYYNGDGYQSWHSASDDAYNFQVGCNSSNTYNFVMCVKFTLSSPANSVTIGLKNNGSWNVGEVHPMRVNISSTDNDPNYRNYKGSSADATFYWTSQYSVASVTVNKKLNSGTYYAYISAWYSGYGAYSEATNKSLSVSYAEAGTYTLTKSQGAGTSLTTTLNSSPFRSSGTALSSGATIYGGETIKVTYSANTGYTNATAKYGSTTISSGGTFTVSGSVTVASSASVLSYKLSTSAGTGSSITVNRTSSPKAGASTGNLSNGATIYYSDVLKITFSASTGYTIGTHTVNGSSFTSGNSHTVTGAVNVVSTATVNSFTLTKNQGTGTTLTVKRTSSPKAGASTGNLNSGATIYYSDVLQISFSASEGYSINAHTVNGSTFTSGANHTVTGNVTAVSSAVVQSFKLSISAGTGSTITVQRTSSPKAGASTGNLSNNATIYYSDVLKITFGTSSSTYSLSTHTVNGSTFTSGDSKTVTGAVSVVSSATLKTYTLTITKDSNSNVVVKRGTTTLSSGASVTYGDVLTISFSANVGYSVSTHTVNGSTFTSGSTHTVSGAVNVVASSVQTIFSFTKSQGANTSLSVKRNGVEISSGTSLNYGDVLTVTYSASSGYTMSKATINGDSVESGSTHTVTSNITVLTQATANPHSLTISQGTNTEVVVMRGTERLYSGAVVSTDDVLTITFNAISGYHITIHNVNGTPFTSGDTHTVSGNVLIVSASATSGSLAQPSNISPDDVNGTGSVDVSNDLDVSWEVNGNVSMIAYKIDIYQNDAMSTLLLSTGKQDLQVPFWGHDYLGKAQRFETSIPSYSLLSAGIMNGGEYKLIVTQWWSDSDSISQTTASVFVARSTPNLTVSFNGSDGTTEYFKADYSQAEGAPINWIRWQIFESSVSGVSVYDSGPISGTGDLMVGYSGMIPDTEYHIVATVETVDGVQVTDDFAYTLTVDDTYVFSGAVSACQMSDNSVKVTWDPQEFASEYVVHRRKVGENFTQKVGAVSSSYTEVIDYSASSSASFIYYVFPIRSDGTICVPGISDEVSILFRTWEIIEASEETPGNYRIIERYYFRYGSGGISENGFSNNNAPTISQNFTRYPVRQADSAMYLTGGVTGLIGTVQNGEYHDTIEQSRKLFSLSTSINALFLLDPEGHFLMVHTSAPIEMSVGTKSYSLPKTMTVQWVEIGSTDGITFFL